MAAAAARASKKSAYAAIIQGVAAKGTTESRPALLAKSAGGVPVWS